MVASTWQGTIKHEMECLPIYVNIAVNMSSNLCILDILPTHGCRHLIIYKIQISLLAYIYSYWHSTCMYIVLTVLTQADCSMSSLCPSTFCCICLSICLTDRLSVLYVCWYLCQSVCLYSVCMAVFLSCNCIVCHYV